MSPRRLLAALLLASAPALAAEGLPPLELPVDCRPGIDCFVQNYVDVDPGPGARDYTCGPLTYDTHHGTDIRLPTRREMRRGVAVLAAAAGRVSHIRDEMPDDGSTGGEAPGGTVRLCGNGVLIAHGEGWTTQYCHMKQGSIAVRPGQSVAAGARLGEIGFSGKTEFPHLHFAVRRGQTVLDPFTGRSAAAGCGARPGDAALWSAAAGAALAYRPSGVLVSGFAERVPEQGEVEAGELNATALAPGAPALLFWVEIYGLRQGDLESLRLLGPRGEVLAQSRPEPAPRDRAVQFRYVGRRRPGSAWPGGDYLGEYRLLREIDGARKEVLRLERTLSVR